MKHAIKLEDLNLDIKTANSMVETFKEILSDLGYSGDRIENVSCRRYDGFTPHSHNKGGILAICYVMNSQLYGSGYDYGDDVIKKWNADQYEAYQKDHPGKSRYIIQVQEGKRPESNTYEALLEHQYEYVIGDSDYDSSAFEVRFMVKPDGSIDVDVFGCTKDAPYFRRSDYNKNTNLEFRNSSQFKKAVTEFFKTCDCVDLIDECY